MRDFKATRRIVLAPAKRSLACSEAETLSEASLEREGSSWRRARRSFQSEGEGDEEDEAVEERMNLWTSWRVALIEGEFRVRLPVVAS